jgi:gamma-glutamyltranspeptidase
MTRRTASGSNFAVAAPHDEAAKAGFSAFEAGGNAVDAAVAAAGMLSVVYPHMTGVGGDLFSIVVRPDGAMECINSSGAAPASVDIHKLRSLGPHMP